MRIAMWSGPRNLSTAMMYSFAARRDCAVWDEPYYAAYLAASGAKHPMLQEILAAGPLDADEIATRCSGNVPDGKAVFYQKHMTHHLLPGFDRSWFKDVSHVFLIRDPVRVVASYHAKREHPTITDIGFLQQAQIFDEVKVLTDRVPVVVDSHDILQNPETMLRRLCERIGIGFEPAMLQWPQGGHKDDGAWAPHWYKSVWQSEGFGKPEGDLPNLSGAQAEAIVARARPAYESLAAVKIQLG